MRNASNSRAIAYRDVGNEREQGCGSVTYISRLDLDHIESQLDSPRLMQRFLVIILGASRPGAASGKRFGSNIITLLLILPGRQRTYARTAGENRGMNAGSNARK